MTTRTESDSLGTIEVPSDAYWGAQTQRSKENFAIGGQPMPLAVVHALAQIKKAAARVNHRLGELPEQQAQLIEPAATKSSPASSPPTSRWWYGRPAAAPRAI